MVSTSLAEQIKAVLGEKRYIHSLGVAETAAKLAEIYQEGRERALTAGLIHDIARDFTDAQLIETGKKYGIEADAIEKAAPNLLHGKVGAEICRVEYGITDELILNAVRCHTTGRQGMTTLDKILFMADMVEPSRSCPGVNHLRELAFSDLDKAVIAGLDSTIRYVLARGLLIHPSSIESRNSLIIHAGT